MSRSGSSQAPRRRGRARGLRRAWQRLRRGLRPLNLAAAALVVISAVVVVQALRGPPARVSSFRTDPVLRALGIPDEEPTADLVALTQVPSLSASPRFVLPLVRGDHKRLLAALPPVAPGAPVVVARPALPETAVPESAPVTIATLPSNRLIPFPSPSILRGSLRAAAANRDRSRPSFAAPHSRPPGYSRVRSAS